MQLTGKETDEILAVASAAGVHDAFELLVRRHGAAVRTLLERLVGHYHDAWDLTQEVWLKVHRSLGTFDARRSFKPWLLRIAANHGRDALRRGAVRAGLGSVAPGGGEGEPHEAWTPDPTGRLADRAAIAHALDQVDEPFREALVLVDVLGLSYTEAAEAAGCALGTVKSRVARGRSEFRRHYEGSTGAPGGERDSSRARPRAAGGRRPLRGGGGGEGSILPVLEGGCWSLGGRASTGRRTGR